MSIDYNEKFLELRKKLAKISDDNSEFNQNNNSHKNRLRELELKTNQKLNIFSNNFTSLKNQFISKTSNYTFPNKKSYSPKSFDYSNYKKVEDNNNNYLKNYRKKISEDINRNIIEQQNNINMKFVELESKIKNVFEQIQKNRNNIKKDIVLLANNVKYNIEDINMKIEDKNKEEQNILISIGENFKKEIDNVNELIKELKKDKEKSNANYKTKINEINEWIQNNFEKERKKREAFQKNVLGILKDTCQKLSDDFYGQDNENEEENEGIEENEEGEENENYEEGDIEEQDNFEEQDNNNFDNHNNGYVYDKNADHIFIEENVNNMNIYQNNKYDKENNDYNEEYIEEEQEEQEEQEQ